MLRFDRIAFRFTDHDLFAIGRVGHGVDEERPCIDLPPLTAAPVVLVAILLAGTRGLLFRYWNSARKLYEISSLWALF